MRRLILPIVPALLAGLPACAPESAGQGAVLYRQHCAGCHGAGAAGDGPLAADLPVAPADLRGLAAGNGGVFPAERAMLAIYGYRGKAYQGLMPEFGSILDGRTVMWTAPDGRVVETPAALVALAAYLETVQSP